MKLTKTEMIENIKKARSRLDAVYYALEDSSGPVQAEICRLMSWCDTCAMDAEIEIEKLEA